MCHWGHRNDISWLHFWTGRCSHRVTAVPKQVSFLVFGLLVWMITLLAVNNGHSGQRVGSHIRAKMWVQTSSLPSTVRLSSFGSVLRECFITELAMARWLCDYIRARRRLTSSMPWRYNMLMPPCKSLVISPLLAVTEPRVSLLCVYNVQCAARGASSLFW